LSEIDGGTAQMPYLRNLAPAVTIMGLLLIAPRPAFAQQGDVYESGSSPAPSSQTLSIEISQASADLDHGLGIEIEVERIDSGAENIWKRSSATVSKYEPQCFVDYNAAHNLIPTLNKQFLAKDYNGANATAKQASTFLSAAETCSNKPLVAQANTGGGTARNPMDNQYYVPPTANTGAGGSPPTTVTNPEAGTAPNKISTPLKAGVGNVWNVWNQGVASAINSEFQQRTASFRSQYNGGARVPLSVKVQYSVAKQPWIYNGKNLNYHIVITNVNWDAIPSGNYGLNSQGLQNLRNAYVNLIEASIYAAQASYQSRLTFPQPVPNNTVPKSGTFGNDPGKPELTYGDGPPGD
jgi:hypothetical protein